MTKSPRKDDRIIRALGEADQERARKLILAALETRRFERHAEGKSSGDFPIAMLTFEIAKRIEAKSRVVRLSTATAKEKVQPEPDGHGLSPEDYRWVQEYIDKGERIFDDKKPFHIHVAGKRDDKLWDVVLKSTTQGEVYLQSLRRTRPPDVERLLRRGEGR